MKDLTKYFTWVFVAGLLIAAFYYFLWKPALENEFKRGLSQCQADTDTLYLPGKDSVIYRDTSFSATKPVEVKDTDSLLVFTTSFDTSAVSGKDTITNKSIVKIEVKKENGKWNIGNPKARWFSSYRHKDFIRQPDTIKIYFPKYVEVPIKETNWLMTGIAYVAGVVSAIIIFLTAN